MKYSKTKLLIADTFIELTQQMRIDKISVTMIVERLNKNRKAFYYHFSNIDSLIQWIYRRDLGIMLAQHFSPDKLVYEGETGCDYAEFPYYIAMKDSTDGLNHSVFFEVFAECLRNRYEFYRNVFLFSGSSSFEDYLYNLYYPQIKSDVITILNDRHMGRKELNFLATFYTGAVIFITKTRLRNRMMMDSSDEFSPFENIIHDSLSLLIEENAQKLRHHY